MIPPYGSTSLTDIEIYTRLQPYPPHLAYVVNPVYSALIYIMLMIIITTNKVSTIIRFLVLYHSLAGKFVIKTQPLSSPFQARCAGVDGVCVHNNCQCLCACPVLV